MSKKFGDYKTAYMSAQAQASTKKDALCQSLWRIVQSEQLSLDHDWIKLYKLQIFEESLQFDEQYEDVFRLAENGRLGGHVDKEVQCVVAIFVITRFK